AHAEVAIERVAEDVVPAVADMEVARRVGEHVEHVELLAGRRDVDLRHPLRGPRALPLRFDATGVVRHRAGSIATVHRAQCTVHCQSSSTNVTGPSFSKLTTIISRNRPVFTGIPVAPSSVTKRSNRSLARSGSSALSKLGRRPRAIEPASVNWE